MAEVNIWLNVHSLYFTPFTLLLLGLPAASLLPQAGGGQEKMETLTLTCRRH